METLILFAPLVGALIGGFRWRLIGEQAAMWVTTGLLFVACFFSWVVFLGHDGTLEKIQILLECNSHWPLDCMYTQRLTNNTSLLD